MASVEGGQRVGFQGRTMRKILVMIPPARPTTTTASAGTARMMCSARSTTTTILATHSSTTARSSSSTLTRWSRWRSATSTRLAIDRANAECDFCFLRGSNYHPLADELAGDSRGAGERLRIPVIALGRGGAGTGARAARALGREPARLAPDRRQLLPDCRRTRRLHGRGAVGCRSAQSARGRLPHPVSRAQSGPADRPAAAGQHPNG